MKFCVLVPLFALPLIASGIPAQQVERPPATPLVAHDPYFSVWSTTDKLTDSPTKHWTGHPQPLNSMVRIDGKTYRVMGSDPRNVPALEQTGSELTPTHTRYHFTGVAWRWTLPSSRLRSWTIWTCSPRPVTYLTWTAHSTDGAQHQVSAFLNANAEMATSYTGQPVAYSRQQTEAATVLPSERPLRTCLTAPATISRLTGATFTSRFRMTLLRRRR